MLASVCPPFSLVVLFSRYYMLIYLLEILISLALSDEWMKTGQSFSYFLLRNDPIPTSEKAHLRLRIVRMEVYRHSEARKGL